MKNAIIIYFPSIIFSVMTLKNMSLKINKIHFGVLASLLFCKVFVFRFLVERQNEKKDKASKYVTMHKNASTREKTNMDRLPYRQSVDERNADNTYTYTQAMRPSISMY